MPPALQWVLQNLTRNLGCEVGLAKAIFGAGSFAPSEQALRHKKNIRVNIECARLRALSSPEPAPGGVLGSERRHNRRKRAAEYPTTNKECPIASRFEWPARRGEITVREPPLPIGYGAPRVPCHSCVPTQRSKFTRPPTRTPTRTHNSFKV